MISLPPWHFIPSGFFGYPYWVYPNTRDPKPEDNQITVKPAGKSSTDQKRTGSG